MTVERYILRQLVVGFLFAAGGMTFIALPGILVSAAHRLSGVGMGAMVGYLPLLLLSLVPYLIPIGFLLAVVATYGRLAADNEWTAMCMAGIHPLRLVRPAALLALVLGGALYYLATDVAPRAQFAERSYTKTSAMRFLRSLNPGRTEIKLNKFYLSARARDPQDRNVFRQVVISMPQRGDMPAEIVFAQQASFSFDEANMTVDLVAPRWIGAANDARVGAMQIKTDLDELFGTGEDSRNDWKFQPNPELARRIGLSRELLAREGEAALAARKGDYNYIQLRWLNAAAYDLHSREALAGVCAMFLLLGVPTGLLLRRGSQLGALAAAVGYALVYYLLSMQIGRGLAWSGALPQWLAAWGTTFLGLLAGSAMCFFALRR